MADMASANGLLERFQPALRYDSNEQFFADSAAQYTDAPGIELRRAAQGGRPGALIASAVPTGRQPKLSLAFLSPLTYANGAKVEKTDVIGVRGTDYRAQYVRLRVSRPDLNNRMYGRAVQANGRLWLQYWLWYFYNDYQLAHGFGTHEGDWECIQLRMGIDGDVPDVAVFAQHRHGEKRNWEDVEKLTDNPDAPVAYVARGSHAAYFEQGYHQTEAWYDIADGKRLAPKLVLEIIEDATHPWMRWPGRWGDTTPDPGDPLGQASPTGPGAKQLWHSPDGLLDNATASVVRTTPRAPDVTVTRRDGARMHIEYDVSSQTITPHALVVTVESRNEQGVPPITHTFADVAGRPKGTISTDIVLHPARHYTIYASTVAGDPPQPSASQLTEIEPIMPEADQPRRESPLFDPRATGTLIGAGNDTVGDVDQLNFSSYVNAFADLITSRDTKPPLTIGIFGSWGMGKSFLLQHIEREIRARQKAAAGVPNPDIVRVHVVRFNAWEYSATEVVWPGLVRKIVTELDKLSTWPLHKRLWTRLTWNLSRQWRHLRTKLVTGAVIVAVAIIAALVNGEQSIAGTIGGVVAVFGLGGVVKAAKEPVAQWITALFAESDYGRRLGLMEDIRHDLEALEARLHRKQRKETRRQDAGGEKQSQTKDIVDGRILVLIDDLDRCEPAKAVEVLQAVSLLLNFPSFVVCLGIDARIITGAIEKHYEGLLGKAGASGYEYLDKIVQIPFRIPEPGLPDILTFVAGQLGNPTKPEQKESQDGPLTEERSASAGGDVPESDDDTSAGGGAKGRRTSSEGASTDDGEDTSGSDPDPELALPHVASVPFTYVELAAFELFAPYLRPNPRHLKRLVNVYRLVRALARTAQQPETLIADRPAATIRWLIMWAQWPYASLAMLEQYDELLDSWGSKVPTDAPAGDPLQHLLMLAEKNGLDPEIRDRLDDEAAALAKLLAIDKDCALDWEQIGRIRRFTVNFNPAVEEQVRQPATSAPTGLTA